MNATSNMIFTDAKGVIYAIRDVAGAGDCALLALLRSPNFRAPLSSSDELRRFVVSFVRGPGQFDCSQVYAIVGDRSHLHIEVYLDNVLMPRFWIGTIFFIWTLIALGIRIRSHYFNEFREPKLECTASFLKQYFPNKYGTDEWPTVDVFFHQYGNMARCKPSMYNHFASMIVISPEGTAGFASLNEVVNETGLPWWRKTEEVNGYDCSKKQLKPRLQKKSMSKEERKQYNQPLTYHYLKQQDCVDEVAELLEERLKKASSDMDDLNDVGIVENEPEEKPSESVAVVRSYSSKHEHRTWLQRANIIFLFLHTRILGLAKAVRC